MQRPPSGADGGPFVFPKAKFFSYVQSHVRSLCAHEMCQSYVQTNWFENESILRRIDDELCVALLVSYSVGARILTPRFCWGSARPISKPQLFNIVILRHASD